MKSEIVFTIFNANTYFHLILETDNDSNQDTEQMNREKIGDEMDKIDSKEVMTSSSEEEAEGRQSIEIMF